MVTRRDFLKAAALTGGGLALALDTRIAKAEIAHHGVRGPSVFTPNAWIRIHADDTVVVVVDKSEMGQGVMTALPMLVAEELDADWGRLQIAQAPAAPAYINPVLGAEATGGSTSVSSSYRPLRVAGAAARLMLLRAASLRTGIAMGHLHTARGAVLLPDGRRLPYGTLARAAARLRVPHDPPLKSPRHFHLIGRPLARIDTPAKTTGQAIFGIDVQRPGLLLGAVRRPPTVNGRLCDYDARAAQGLPGVLTLVRVDRGLGVVATDTWAAWKALMRSIFIGMRGAARTCRHRRSAPGIGRRPRAEAPSPNGGAMRARRLPMPRASLQPITRSPTPRTRRSSR